MRALGSLLSIVCLSLPCTIVQDPSPQPGAARAAAFAQLQRLGWLAGTWRLQDGKTTTEEHWRPLQGATMLGTSHTFAGDRTSFFEFLRIAIQKDRVVYVAMPGGGPGTTFVMSKLEEGVVEFENARHDHPQRIRYAKTDAGVTATISQLDGSRAMEFVFTAK